MVASTRDGVKERLQLQMAHDAERRPFRPKADHLRLLTDSEPPNPDAVFEVHFGEVADAPEVGGVIPQDQVAEGVDERLDVVPEAVGLPWVAQDEGGLELPGTLLNVLAILTTDRYMGVHIPPG